VLSVEFPDRSDARKVRIPQFAKALLEVLSDIAIHYTAEVATRRVVEQNNAFTFLHQVLYSCDLQL